MLIIGACVPSNCLHFIYDRDFKNIENKTFESIFEVQDSLDIVNSRLVSNSDKLIEVAFFSRFIYCIFKSQDSTYLSFHNRDGSFIDYLLAGYYPQGLQIRNGDLFVSCFFGDFRLTPSGKLLDESPRQIPLTKTETTKSKVAKELDVFQTFLLESRIANGSYVPRYSIVNQIGNGGPSIFHIYTRLKDNRFASKVRIDSQEFFLTQYGSDPIVLPENIVTANGLAVSYEIVGLTSNGLAIIINELDHSILDLKKRKNSMMTSQQILIVRLRKEARKHI
jgi:hypothetical protein